MTGPSSVPGARCLVPGEGLVPGAWCEAHARWTTTAAQGAPGGPLRKLHKATGSWALGLGLTLLFASGAPAQQATSDLPPRPTPGPEKTFRLSARDERVLPNGLKVIVVRKATVPKVSTILTVKTGLAADPPELPGLAALTAEAIQEGTATRDSRQIRREAFAMGANLSATAVQDYTSVTLRGLSAFTPRLLDLLADVVMRPTFPEHEVAIIKANRLQALRQEKSSPQFLSENEFRRRLFGSHPYSRITTTADAIQTIDRTRLGEFHAAHYRPNNAILIVVGDVEPAGVFAVATKVFGDWPRKPLAKGALPEAPALKGRKVVFVQRPNSIQSSISLGNFAVKRSDPRWYSLQLANTIYGGAFNSRIVRNLREEKGYTYSPFSQFGAFADAGFYRFAADVRNEVTGATLAEIFKEIDKFRAEGSQGAELEGAKQYLKGVFSISTATQPGLANAVNTIFAFDLPADYLETYQARISAVTPEGVKTAAQTLLRSDDSVIVIVGDYPKVKEQLGAFAGITFIDVDGKTMEKPSSQ